MQFVYQAMAA